MANGAGDGVGKGDRCARRRPVAVLTCACHVRLEVLEARGVTDESGPQGGDIAEPIIDIEDIADVAVAALTEDGHRGKLYEVTGPELMAFADMADVLGQATGRPVRHVPISFEAFHANVAASGGSFVADVFTAIARETLDGRNAHTTDGVMQALGRAPRSFAAFAAEAARSGAWASAA